MNKRKFDKNDVNAGREYIERYVSFIHYVEKLYEDAKKIAGGHFDEHVVQSKE